MPTYTSYLGECIHTPYVPKLFLCFLINLTLCTFILKSRGKMPSFKNILRSHINSET